MDELRERGGGGQADPRRVARDVRRVRSQHVRRHAAAGSGPARRGRAPRGRAGADDVAFPTEPFGRARRRPGRWTDFNLAIVLDRLGEYEAAGGSGSTSSSPPTRTPALTASSPDKPPPISAITLRKLRRYGDEFPLRVRVPVTPANPGPRQHRDLQGGDRAGPGPSASRQPRNGSGTVHRGSRRSGTKWR